VRHSHNRTPGFHCRLLIADCRLKKSCGSFLPCQSAIENRQSKIGNSSRVSSADILWGRNPNRGGTLPLPSIRRNFAAHVTAAIPAQDSAWQVGYPSTGPPPDPPAGFRRERAFFVPNAMFQLPRPSEP
jgi:hypothetical protein